MLLVTSTQSNITHAQTRAMAAALMMMLHDASIFEQFVGGGVGALL